MPDASTSVFTTERLVVRDWADDEAQRMYDIYSRDEVVRFLGSVPTPMRDPAVAAQRIAAHRANNADIAPCGWWALEVRETGVVAGTVAVVPVADHPDVVEVAWHLHPDSQGHGYATEAAAGALQHAQAVGLGDVIALTAEENTASQAVCRRLGLEVRETSERFYGKRLMVWGRPRG